MISRRIIIAQTHHHDNIINRFWFVSIISIGAPRKRLHSAIGRPFSSSKNTPTSKSFNHTSSSSSSSSSQPSSSKISQLFDSLTSSASQTVSKATEKATHVAAEATEAAAKKATTATTKATSNIRRSLSSAKINAKQTGEQYVREAHRSASRMGNDAKQSAEVAARKTGERMKKSISDASQSAASRLKDTISQRIPKMPELPFAKTSSSTITSYSTPILPNARSKMKLILSDALPSKEALLKSASRAATETLSMTTANVTTRVQETVSKTTRWLWWWGLAAVGVYGISTTLTKEGVQLLKDTVNSSKKSLTGISGIGAEATSGAAAVPDSNAIGASRNNEAVVHAAEDISSEDGNKRSGRWLSSWFSSGANKPAQ